MQLTDRRVNLKEIPSGCAWIIAESSTDLHRVQTAYFKRVFSVAEQMKGSISISAHSRYQLYLNGTFISAGPCKGDAYHQYCDRIDISPYLKNGSNTMVVKVVSFPVREARQGDNSGADWAMSKAIGASLLLWGRAGEEELSTGKPGWVCRESKELTPKKDPRTFWLGYMEQVDGRELLPGEEFTSEHVSSPFWKAGKRLWEIADSPYGVIPVFDLFERPIPPLFLREKQFGRVVADSAGKGAGPGQVIRIPANTVYWVELDAGELTTGYFRLMCLAGKGAQVTILYSEGYQEIVSKPGEAVTTKKRCRDQAENSILEGHEDRFLLSGRSEQYIPFSFRTFRFVRLEVAAQEFETVIKLPDYLETGYPLEDKTKFLSASEEWLEPLWEVSKRTLHRCMHETYEDCPYYEQMQYTMDTRLQCLFTYALSGDTRLAARAIYDYHCSQLPDGMLQSRYPCCEPQVIPPFALHWIFMLWDYYWETGENKVLDRYLGTVLHVLGYFRRRKKEGLVEHLGYWEMADWAPEWNGHYGVPHACDNGPSTIFNFMYSSALQTAARIMETLSLQDFAGKLLQEAEQINQTIHRHCFDTQRNLYRDGPQTEEYSQLAQVWAVLAGTQDPYFRKALMVQVQQEKELILCTFPCQFYLLRAYEKTGLYDQTAEVWGALKQQLDLHLTTLPETPADSRSDCHAWSALLLYEFPRKMLGVSAMSPGYQSILVEPKAWYLQEASGIVHTPKGEISISWRLEEGKAVLQLEHRCNVPVEVRLPDGRICRADSFGKWESLCILDKDRK